MKAYSCILFDLDHTLIPFDSGSVFTRFLIVRGALPAGATTTDLVLVVTERLRPFLPLPTMQVRQTGEGVVQIGDSMEDVGFDDSTSLPQLARIAARALRCFPLLAGVNIVRTWGALRVMTPDGYPIYEASSACPGAFVVTCHSGITLAAQHAGPLAGWIRGGAEPAEIAGFKAARFDQAAQAQHAAAH